MLAGLGEVEWGRFTHAYGNASDVPDLIRALSSDSEEERGEALGELFSNIWHQGTVYETAALAVPFLIELLAQPGIRGKDGILQLLACIGQGRSYIDVHAHVFDQIGTGPPSEEEQADHETRLTRELGWVRAAREAVEAGVRTYLTLLTDEAPEVRIFAAYTLGHCQGRAAQVVPEVVARVSAESDARSRAALILAVGSLKAAVDEKGEVASVFTERIGSREDPVVRLAAAMGSATSSSVEPTPEIIDTLSVSTGLAWSDFEGLPWCEGGVAVRVGEVLAEYPAARLRLLLSLLDSHGEAVRSGARYALEKLCHERRSITAQIAAALANRVLAGSLADRRGSAEILSRLGLASAVAAGRLSVALDDDDPQLRAHAAIALAGLSDPRAIPVLIALLDDERSFPRFAKVLGWLSRSKEPRRLDDHFFPMIADALGGFGEAARNAVPALLDLLKREPPREELLAHNEV